MPSRLKTSKTPPSEKQAEIIKYYREHPGCNRKEIAITTEASQSYVGETLSVYIPEACNPRKITDGPSEKQKMIIKMKLAHPKMTQKEIAAATGTSSSMVSLTITCCIDKNLPKVRRGEKKKKELESEEEQPVKITKMLPCLVCGKPHESTWPGDRIHKECRKKNPEHYIDDYDITIGRKTAERGHA